MTYFCTACAARWDYVEIRYVARCKACGAGLTSTLPAAPRECEAAASPTRR